MLQPVCKNKRLHKGASAITRALARFRSGTESFDHRGARRDALSWPEIQLPANHANLTGPVMLRTKRREVDWLSRLSRTSLKLAFIRASSSLVPINFVLTTDYADDTDAGKAYLCVP